LKLIDKSDNDIIEEFSQLSNLDQKIENTKFEDETSSMMISILSKIAKINSAPCKMILNCILNTSFFDIISKQIKNENFLIKLAKETQPQKIQETSDYINNLITVCDEYTYKFVANLGYLPIDEIRKLLERINKNFPRLTQFFQLATTRIIQLNESVEKIQNDRIERELKAERDQQQKKEEVYNNIPITYKQENLHLTKEEIYNNTKILIQKHRVKGDYETWERYLNTMFYLVREDCYRSLRESVNEISNRMKIESNIDKEFRDIYYYKSVKVKDLQIDVKGIIFTLTFEMFQKRISWSKRLLFGSLVIITKYDFGDIVLGIVNEGPDPKKKQKNNKYECKIQLIDNNYQNFAKFIEWCENEDELHMFESKAYFESYRHILKRIQDIDTRYLPFTDVIINFRMPNTVNYLLPAHYSRNTLMTYNSSSFYLYQDSWPTDLTSRMDSSQLKALKHGLRNKVAIIQGPPGTGKTYVGSILTKILLNKTENPILVVCFTNHALDQFLRHISTFEKKIVRIGGRCKEEALQEFTLNNIKKNNKLYDKQYFHIRKLIKASAEKLKRFTDSFSQSTFLDYKTCYAYFKEFCNRLIEDFYSVCSNSCHLPKSILTNLKKDEIYKGWINPNKINKVADDIKFNDKKQYFKFLDKIKRIQLKTEEFIKNIKSQQPQTEQQQSRQESLDNSLDYEENMMENLDRRELDYEEGDESSQNEDRENLEDDDENIFSKAIEDILLEDINEDYLNGIKTKDIETLINSDTNLWILSTDLRRAIMMYIKKIYVIENLKYIQPDIDSFNKLIQQKKEMEDLTDMKYIKGCKIVGMTTTGCAKYSTFLEQINFETVIIEEAAEVLESHISSILTRNTRQLILIGDHQQLRPNPYNYEICKKYNFDVSLFERLINNKVPYSYLEYQRRMRPEFADFVRLIYKNSYTDHESTKNKVNNKGFSSNIHFLNHKNLEDMNQGLASKSNPYEAKFIAYLAQYIMLQGVKLEKITILTMYIAQVLLIRDELKKLNLDTRLIKVVSVDNYQGEENDYILLSLVRSNKNNEIGFLKTFNRVCVAFSRAVLGFYVLGNFECLLAGQSKNSDPENTQQLWTEIYKLATSKGVIKDHFEFKCQKHNRSTIVKLPEEFKNIPEGGCKEICKERMECGHTCEFFCHNFKHEKFHCKKKCERVLTPCGHVCTLRCDKECGKCKVITEKQLLCGHKINIECSTDIRGILCKQKIKKLVPSCGHIGLIECSGDIKNYICREQVIVTLPCGHKQGKECYMDIEKVICKNPCQEILECEHICTGTCSDCLKGTLHIPCNTVCNKILICSHICLKECSQPCLCDKNCENICHHGFCGLGCNEECIPCNEVCNLGCKHSKCTLLCKQMCNFNCERRCDKKMNCGHQCIGLCGEECPNICRTCKPNDEIFEIFLGNEDDPEALFYKIDCGHVFELQGLDQHMGLKSDHYNIKAKTCLRCFKPIVKGLRYSNLTKSTFNLIQKIKANYMRQYGDFDMLYEKTKHIISQVTTECNLTTFKNSIINTLFKNIKNLEKKQYIAELLSFYNLCCLAKEIIEIEKFIDNGPKNQYYTDSSQYRKHFLDNVNKVKGYFDKVKCYSQKFLDNLKRKVNTLYLASVAFSNMKFANYIPQLDSRNYMLSQSNIDRLHEVIPRINQAEMMEIMNLSGGTWYHCPNGHLYSVGECGRPMQESTCPTCSERIGGANHNPHANNRQFTGFNNI
jgi:superfamily I DNA and/or RNA helicase